MGIEFNTEDMLDTYLFENSQLLENLQEIVLEQKDEDYFDEDSINEIFRTMKEKREALNEELHELDIIYTDYSYDENEDPYTFLN